MLWAIVCESVCASSSGHSQSISGAPKRTSKSLGLTLCECGVQLHAFDANTVRSLSLWSLASVHHIEREAATVKRRKKYLFIPRAQTRRRVYTLFNCGGRVFAQGSVCEKFKARENALSLRIYTFVRYQPYSRVRNGD
jgi:hypothetical protein